MQGLCSHSRSGFLLLPDTGVAALHIYCVPHRRYRVKEKFTSTEGKNKKKLFKNCLIYVLQKSRWNKFETFWPIELILVNTSKMTERVFLQCWPVRHTESGQNRQPSDIV